MRATLRAHFMHAYAVANSPSSSPSKVALGKEHSIRADIQGLRALAVLAVMVFHVNSGWLNGGFLGVDVFFVISGYLVTGIVLRSRMRGGFSFFAFYRSRLKRIAPAYYVMLIGVTAVAAILLLPQDFAFYKHSLAAAVYFASNVYYAGFDDYFAPRSAELPLLHTWSLAIEMQFYLVLPLIVVITPKRYWRPLFPVLILLLTAGANYARYLTFQQEDYYSLAARAPEFLLGASMAAFGMDLRMKRFAAQVVATCGLAVMLGGFVLIDKTTIYAGFSALLPCLGAVALIGTPGSAINRALSIRPLRRIGDLSYSLYLWHWPVLALMRYYGQSQEFSAIELAAFLASTFVISWLSYRFVESQFRNAAQWGTDLRAAAYFAALAGATVLLAPSLNVAVASPLRTEQARFADPDLVCNGRVVADCIRGDRDADREILVIGDSHGAQLNRFFDAVGSARHIRARVITNNGCVNIPGFDLQRLRPYARPTCAAQIEAAAAHFDKAEYIVIAGLWGYHAESEPFMRALDDFLTAMDSRKKQVWILAQFPLLNANVARAHRFEQLGVPIVIRRTEGWENGNRKVEELTKRHTNARFVDLSRSDFFASAPFYKGELMYRDSSHLNEVGAYRLGELSIANFP